MREDGRLRPSWRIVRDSIAGGIALAIGIYSAATASEVAAWAAFIGGFSGAGLLIFALTDWRAEISATAKRMGWE